MGKKRGSEKEAGLAFSRDAAHNYAVNANTGEVKRSASNGHAELKLLALENGQRDVHLISEFKPCPDCQRDLTEFEQTYQVKVEVDYFIDYQGTGDGDKDKVRNFYKAKGYLSGGGDYVYQVVQGWEK